MFVYRQKHKVPNDTVVKLDTELVNATKDKVTEIVDVIAEAIHAMPENKDSLKSLVEFVTKVLSHTKRGAQTRLWNLKNSQNKKDIKEIEKTSDYLSSENARLKESVRGMENFIKHSLAAAKRKRKFSMQKK